MLKRFASPEFENGFASAFGAESDPLPAFSASLPAARSARGRDDTRSAVLRAKTLTLAGAVAAIGLAGMGAAVAQQALTAIATAPASETATWALMLVGLGMIGFAARRKTVGGTPSFPLAGRASARNGRPDPCW